MAQPVTISVTGAIQAAPAVSTALAPSLSDTVQFGTNRTYSYKISNNFSINNPIIGSPFDVPLGSITKVRFMFIRTIGASVLMLVTSPADPDPQLIYVAEEMFWSSPSEGTQLTAIQLVGVTDVEMIISGD